MGSGQWEALEGHVLDGTECLSARPGRALVIVPWSKTISPVTIT